MKHVSLKLLVLYGVVCGIFFITQSGFCATNEPIANKSSKFSMQLSNSAPDNSMSDDTLAEKIRAQRAALDARDMQSNVTQKLKSGSTKNNCDADLRKCMESRCGSNYAKCEKDSETIFSDKINACKKNAKCTAHEFTLFANEIKEDKKQAIRLSLYNKTIDCGNRYNDCIISECGKTFNKCLSKTSGDKALSKCKSIATECTEADSGLSGRVGNVFGIVRQDAEKQIKTDEKRLYTLREQMQNSCRVLGAMFDERSLDCVFTANFYAGDDSEHPKASQKLYAGSLFDCTPDWFGIDVTTYKENAYRATRAQTAASSAMLGSGIGTAVGSITSGALDRAIDSKKAKDAMNAAKNEQGNNGGNQTNTPTETPNTPTPSNSGNNSSNAAQNEQGNNGDNGQGNNSGDGQGNNGGNQTNTPTETPNTSTPSNQGNNSSSASASAATKKKNPLRSAWCENSGGKWDDTKENEDEKCDCTNAPDNRKYNKETESCLNIAKQKTCTESNGEYNTILNECGCGNFRSADATGKCVENKDEKSQKYLRMQKDCVASGGTWPRMAWSCLCNNAKGKQEDGTVASAICVTPEVFKEHCKAAGGKLDNSGKCKCKTDGKIYNYGKCLTDHTFIFSPIGHKCPKGFDGTADKCMPNNKNTCQDFGGSWDKNSSSCLCNGAPWKHTDACATKDENYK